MPKVATWIFFVLLVACVQPSRLLQGRSPAAADYTLQLLHVADQEAGAPALDDVPRFSAVLNALREDFANTITLGSGDVYIPGVFFSASVEVYGSVGRADILIQNQLGFQAIALGNHEFDVGPSGLRALIVPGVDDPTTEIDESYEGTQFPYLSSNLDFSTDPNLADLVVPDDQAPLPNSISGTTFIVVNGEKIGVVGATTPTLPSISNSGSVTVAPAPFQNIPTPAELDALTALIQTEVDELLAAHPDMNKVILLAHMQRIGIEEQLATRLRNVDIIVAGGSNTRISDETDRLRVGDVSEGVYPFFTQDIDGNPIAVVNTDANYKYVGRLVIGFDSEGILLPETYDETISGIFATDDAGVASLDAQNKVDPIIQQIVDSLRDSIFSKESNVLGVSTVYLNGAAREQETNLGDLSADANLAAGKKVDPSAVLSLVTGGSIRDSIGIATVPAGSNEVVYLPNEAIPGVKPAGGISQTDVINSLRFNGDIVLLSITAAEIKEAIEHGLKGVGARSGAFPQVSGMKFSYNPTAPMESRVQSMVILTDDGPDVIVQNGQLVGDSSRQFRMVALAFTAGGGDGYNLPQRNLIDISGEDEAPTGAATFTNDNTEQDALAEYLLANYATADQAFSLADVGEAQDERIQNLAVRADTVIPATSTSPAPAASASRSRTPVASGSSSRTSVASASRSRIPAAASRSSVPSSSSTPLTRASTSRRPTPSPLPSPLGVFTVSRSRSPTRDVVVIPLDDDSDNPASHLALGLMLMILVLLL